MPLRPRLPSRSRARRLVPIALLAAAVLFAACAAEGPQPVVFDPGAPCPEEGQQPGAYPDLEALIPTEIEGTEPDSLDSGRSCTAAALGTLAGEGIGELRYAGGTWPAGGSSGWTLAVFTADGLDPVKMRAFYQAGAAEARRSEKVVASTTTVGGVPAERLDVLMSDGTGQTVVAWQEAVDGPVWVLLAADIGDTRVAELLEVLGSR
jgi:hypothetical protein